MVGWFAKKVIMNINDMKLNTLLRNSLINFNISFRDYYDSFLCHHYQHRSPQKKVYKTIMLSVQPAFFCHYLAHTSASQIDHDAVNSASYSGCFYVPF